MVCAEPECPVFYRLGFLFRPVLTSEFVQVFGRSLDAAVCPESGAKQKYRAHARSDVRDKGEAANCRPVPGSVGYVALFGSQPRFACHE
jgi:hypothetical protein